MDLVDQIVDLFFEIYTKLVDILFQVLPLKWSEVGKLFWNNESAENGYFESQKFTTNITM